ncbi:hypothetical protein OsccyDRAFT_2558 [Leptolyngbyaceae cyanobacterium JSC-12]|nr:hypothetical protein OsccyDRAFT_2558 [Leptolyngbyaceae cyanobacterium JSC-12]
MLDLNSLLAFSHTHCVAICAALVPLNLLLTLLTLIFVGMGRPKAQVWQSTGWAIAVAVLMLLHVCTWLMVGVVRIPSFVLFTLAICCLSLNVWALQYPHSLNSRLRVLIQSGRRLFQSLVQQTEAL